MRKLMYPCPGLCPPEIGTCLKGRHAVCSHLRYVLAPILPTSKSAKSNAFSSHEALHPRQASVCCLAWFKTRTRYSQVHTKIVGVLKQVYHAKYQVYDFYRCVPNIWRAGKWNRHPVQHTSVCFGVVPPYTSRLLVLLRQACLIHIRYLAC